MNALSKHEERAIKPDVNVKADDDKGAKRLLLCGVSYGPRGTKRKLDEVEFIVLDKYDSCDDTIAPYNPELEGYPPSPFYHPSFAKAERCYLELVQSFVNIVEESPYKGTFADFIRSKLQKLKSVTYPADLIVGLRGQSGAGKSSLVNSLLGIDLATESDVGGACTAVVQEFRQRLPHHDTPFAAEIRLVGEELRAEFLRNALQDVWECNAAGLEPKDDNYEPLKRAWATALASLTTIFCSHKEFANAAAAMSFLEGAKSAHDPVILDKLTNWLDQMLLEMDIENDSIMFKCATLEELKARIEPFTRSIGSAASIWPLVDTIRTYLDCRVLKQGIILADLPGTCDSNNLREQISQEYIRKVDYTAVVAPIDRIETNQVVKEHISEALKRRGIQSILVVATRSDQIKDQIMSYVPDHNEELRAHALKNEHIIRSRLKEKDIDLKMKQDEMRIAREKKDRMLVLEIDNQMQQLKFQKIMLKAHLVRECIRLRNRKVAQSLNSQSIGSRIFKNNGGSSLTSPPLPIFCVSNLAYRQNLEESQRTDAPKMDADLSGIPGLRRHLYTLPAEGKFSALTYHCDTLLRGLLNEIELTSTHTNLERKEQLAQRLKKFKAQVEPTVERVLNQYQVTLMDPLLANIKAKQESWIEQAELKLNKWSPWHNMTYRSFVVHNGNWKTPKAGQHNWNAELLESVERDLSQSFDDMDEACADLEAQLCQAFRTLVTDCIDSLTLDAGSWAASLTKFLDDLNLQATKLARLSSDTTARIERGLLLIKDLTFNSKDRTAYFLKQMLRIYQNCGYNISGPGSGMLRVDSLETALLHASKGPYIDMYHDVEKALLELLEQEAATLKAAATDLFVKVEDNFSRHFSIQEDDGEEAKAFRTLLIAHVPRARLVMDNEIAGYLAECRAAGRDSAC